MVELRIEGQIEMKHCHIARYQGLEHYLVARSENHCVLELAHLNIAAAQIAERSGGHCCSYRYRIDYDHNHHIAHWPRHFQSSRIYCIVYPGELCCYSEVARIGNLDKMRFAEVHTKYLCLPRESVGHFDSEDSTVVHTEEYCYEEQIQRHHWQPDRCSTKYSEVVHKHVSQVGGLVVGCLLVDD